MSFWISRLACKNCGTAINVTGGVVGTTHMGPPDDQLVCPNPSCNSTGYASFENIGPFDRNNPEHMDTQYNHKHNLNGD